MKFKESALAHRLLDGLEGIEIGGSAHNSFGLKTRNVDYLGGATLFKEEEIKICGEALPVDIVAKGDELPLADNSVDFVISSHVMEHFPDPIKALKEWRRVVRPGGYIYIIAPHRERNFDRDRPRTPLAELLQRHETGIGPDPNAAHCSVWITKDFVELIRWLGWPVVAVQNIDDKVGNGFAVVIGVQKDSPSKPKAISMVNPTLAPNRHLPWLLLLLVGSGCAALIYEIVWFQLLQLVIGSSAVSLGLLLAAYMGGLCLGSILLPRYVSPRFRPLRVYAYLELGIGALGLVALFGVPVVGRLYLLGASEGTLGLVLRGLVAAICLLPPTVLMGGSLPAIARWVESTPRGVSWLGYLYSANIAGAVAGSLIAGFYLLRVFDMAVATYVAAAVNVAVAVLSLALAARAGGTPVEENAKGVVNRAPRAAIAYVAIALSGLSALGAEVVWTRLLSLLLGATVYTFSIILAVFLVGLWAGSSAASFAVRRLADPKVALAVCQFALALAIAWTAYTLANSLPFWPVDPWLARDPWFNFELDLARCVWAIFPATVLWGASFPLALAAAAGPGEDPARISGEVYAANTAGSIVGSLAFTLVLIPAIGTLGSQQVLIALAMATAVVAAWFSLRRPMQMAAVGMAALAGWGLTATVSDVPWQVVAYGRRVAPIVRAFDLFDQEHPTKVLFRGEGINSSVLIAERAGQRHFYVSGKAEASTAILDMRLERMMGHVPALIHTGPRKVLTVGFGAGVTAGSFVPYPELESLVICELEPFIPPASTEYFGKQNNRVMNDRRTRIVYDDARHYIFTTKDKFDVITTDPIHPWVKGTSTLYSKEYYELVKSRLNPGGVVAQWLPIYDSDPETIKTELATFFAVFPEGSIWSNNLNGDGYDLVLIGQERPGRVSVDAVQARLDRPEYSGVAASIGEVGFHSAVELLATYAGRAQDLRQMLPGAQINDDMNMRLQYIAGLGLNSMSFQKMYRDILSYRKFPEGFLEGTGGRMDALRTLLSPSVQNSRR